MKQFENRKLTITEFINVVVKTLGFRYEYAFNVVDKYLFDTRKRQYYYFGKNLNDGEISYLYQFFTSEYKTKKEFSYSKLELFEDELRYFTRFESEKNVVKVGSSGVIDVKVYI